MQVICVHSENVHDGQHLVGVKHTMEYATVYRQMELFSIDNVPMNCTVPINSMREGGAILKGREVVGLQEKPMDMQEVPRQTVPGSS